MKIRKATKKDIKPMNEIAKQGFYQEWTLHHGKRNKNKIEKDVENELNYSKNAFEKALKNKNQFWIVVEDRKKIKGFGGAYIHKGRGIIKSVYILQENQKKGYGLKIMEELINWLKAKKAKKIESNVLVGNKPSQKLHEKVGFKIYLWGMRLE